MFFNIFSSSTSFLGAFPFFSIFESSFNRRISARSLQNTSDIKTNQPPAIESRKKNFFGRFFFIADSVRSYIRAARIRGQNVGVEIFQKSFSSPFPSAGVDMTTRRQAKDLTAVHALVVHRYVCDRPKWIRGYIFALAFCDS